MKCEKFSFGALPDGRKVDAYRISNSGGAYVQILSLGGIINRLYLPDREGNLSDVVCGFDTVEGYLTGGGYQGALIGRYGNRIGGACFTLGGKNYPLFVNSGSKDHLHGGKEGFNLKIWNCRSFLTAENAGLVLRYTSPDGEEGYPGTLSVTVTYTFDESNRLSLRYEAVTDKETVVNLTNHTYFNLNGYDGGSVMEQRLFLDADTYTAVDDDLIPLPGAPAKVDGTAFDFRVEKPIAVPFDHNFNLNGFNGMVRRCGEVYDPKSGRTLTLYTSAPAVQLYTGCVMNDPVPFKGGVPQRPLHALCLETQYAPNTPNRSDYISCVLRPGEKFDSQTVFAFGVR